MSQHTEIVQDTLVQIAGENTARIRILTVFLSEPNKEFSATDIKRKAPLGSRSSWYDHQEDLLEMDIIHETGKRGRSPMYKLNRDNLIVNLLEAIHNLERYE